jgi:hypothetical protein
VFTALASRADTTSTYAHRYNAELHDLSKYTALLFVPIGAVLLLASML